MFEPLEQRKLFAVTFINGKLTVGGTSGNDNILVKRLTAGVQLTINSVIQGIYQGVNSLVLYGYNGNDTINSRNVPVPTTVQGGAGNDIITTGDSHDFVNPGTGNDTIHGFGGFNVLDYSTQPKFIDGLIRMRPLNSMYAAPYVGARTVGTVDVGGINSEVGGWIPDEHDVFDDFYQINGGSGNDYLAVQVDPDPSTGSWDYKQFPCAAVLAGGSGNDDLRVYGFSDISKAETAPFRALLYGGAGNDFLGYYGFSDSELFGQDGNDTMDVGLTNDLWIKSADGGAGIDLQRVTVHGDQCSIYGGQLAPGFENAELFNSAIEFHGNALSNNIVVHGGCGDIYGESGNDRISLLAKGASYRFIYGDDGNDTIIGTEWSDVAFGGAGNDFLDGNGGDDSLYGDQGKDQLYGEYGNDYLDGGSGNDSIVGSNGNDVLIGGLGNDTMEGGNQNDTFYAKDVLVDLIKGGAGSDLAEYDIDDVLDSIEFPMI